MQLSEKQRLRRELSARRLSLGRDEAEAAAKAAAQNLLKLEAIDASPAVGIYWAHQGELSTAALFRGLRKAGKEVFLPRIEPQEDRLVFASFESEADLAPGAFGVLEPRGPSFREARDLPALVIPGLAFDLAGSRIGWGKGYYDRVLRGYPGHRVGYAYDFQVMEALPRELHDEEVQVLVTEARSIELKTEKRS